MYKAIVNENEERSIRRSGTNKFVIDGNEYLIERFKDEPDLFIVKYARQQFKVQIHNIDYRSKTFQLRLKGTRHTVKIKDKFDLLLEELGMNSRGTTVINQIKAPMPGLILEIIVKPGDKVNKGDKVIVLEAMKMENVIKSPGEGQVMEIKVSKGDSVEKNQVMIQF